MIKRTFRKGLAGLLMAASLFAFGVPVTAGEVVQLEEAVFMQEMALLEELLDDVGGVSFTHTGIQTFTTTDNLGNEVYAEFGLLTLEQFKAMQTVLNMPGQRMIIDFWPEARLVGYGSHVAFVGMGNADIGVVRVYKFITVSPSGSQPHVFLNGVMENASFPTWATQVGLNTRVDQSQPTTNTTTSLFLMSGVPNRLPRMYEVRARVMGVDPGTVAVSGHLWRVQ